MTVLASGNIFTSGAEVLVNTVNCVGVMGKGLALEVKWRFPKVFEDYHYACEAGLVVPGRVFISATGLLPPEGPRFVANLPTKRHWRDGSRLDDIEAGLVDLARRLTVLGVESVAVPALGCRNGGLRWDDVRPLIEEILAGLPMKIMIYPPI